MLPCPWQMVYLSWAESVPSWTDGPPFQDSCELFWGRDLTLDPFFCWQVVQELTYSLWSGLKVSHQKDRWISSVFCCTPKWPASWWSWNVFKTWTLACCRTKILSWCQRNPFWFLKEDASCSVHWKEACSSEAFRKKVLLWQDCAGSCFFRSIGKHPG